MYRLASYGYQLVCFLLGMLIFTHAVAEPPSSQATNRVTLTDKQGLYPLGMHLVILEDPTKTLSIEDVSSKEYASEFTTSKSTSPSYGFSPSAFWVHVEIDRQSFREQAWVLELGYAPMQLIDVYTLYEDGSAHHQRGGSAIPYSERPYPHHKHIFELNVRKKICKKGAEYIMFNIDTYVVR